MGAFHHSVWLATCPSCEECFVAHETIDSNGQTVMEEHYLQWKNTKPDIPQFYLVFGKRKNKDKEDIEKEIKNNGIYELAI